ncbi:hypothetical protein [Yersinia enterocolitica]|uniref:hypothetical protein n=1 Tax=Yersinia enterocolitica TaxID=630 RepID=UPI0032F0EE42|nr:hypothetical protein [Yersinia enterocolitica]HDL7427132.1 hypothetical protein [Yersinia enterocolitica]HDL7431924.1 hypothetical protein [Yersinia enterocolitica]HDL7474369.1 hypothetical protein [Yersinia enterocolitica]HDL8117590.1 hypothetical protein [Yersinia enterocolitica]
MNVKKIIEIFKFFAVASIFLISTVHASSSGLIRMECSSLAGNKVTGLFDGPNQRITFGSAVFTYLGRNDSGNGERLIFQRKVDNDDYFLTLNMDVSPVELRFMTENGILRFGCEGFKA